MTRAQHSLFLLFAFIGFAFGVTLLTLQLLSHRAETNLIADQRKLAGLQEEINRGEISRQVTQNLLQDLSPLAVQKPEVQSLLARYGITLKKNE